MNAKKTLKAAFKSVPESHIIPETRIWIKATDRKVDSKFAILLTHPVLETLIWTEEFGWETLNE